MAMSSLDAAKANARPVGRLGGKFMMAPGTFARGAEIGFEPGYAYYLAGRLGVLGDVHAEVASAAAVFINPALLATTWAEAGAIAPPSVVAAHYAEGCSVWAAENLADIEGLDVVRALGGRVVDEANPALAPVFAGWRALGTPADPTTGGYRVMHLLRELRFARHCVAALGLGLTPVEAIVAGPGGEAGAAMFGWTEQLPPVTPELTARRDEAEDRTDALSAVDFEVLDDAQRADLVDALASIDAALS